MNSIDRIVQAVTETQIVEYLDRQVISVPLSELREAFGGNVELDRQNPLKHPVHAATFALVKAGTIKEIKTVSGFGEPSFSLIEGGKR